MMRSLFVPSRPVSTARRNLVALLVASAALGTLGYSFQSGSGPSAGAPVSLAQFTADLRAGDPTRSGGLTSSGAGQPGVLEGRTAVERDLELLEAGYRRLREVADYTAVMLRQERVGGALGHPEIMQLKLRHSPFSVYMKWLDGEDVGREVLYVDGENDGEMLVKLGGIKGRLLPTIKVDPNGALARSESRHSITEAGLLNLTRTMITHIRRDLEQDTHVRCTMLDGQKFGGRDCYCFVREYDNPEDSVLYRKSVHYVDKEWLLPVSIQNYAWPDGKIDPERLDEATLVERYAYSEIHLQPRLADRDFDRDNAKYSFRR